MDINIFVVLYKTFLLMQLIINSIVSLNNKIITLLFKLILN